MPADVGRRIFRERRGWFHQDVLRWWPVRRHSRKCTTSTTCRLSTVRQGGKRHNISCSLPSGMKSTAAVRQCDAVPHRGFIGNVGFDHKKDKKYLNLWLSLVGNTAKWRKCKLNSKCGRTRLELSVRYCSSDSVSPDVFGRTHMC